MKKLFDTPMMDIALFDVESVITESSTPEPTVEPLNGTAAIDIATSSFASDEKINSYLSFKFGN